MALHIYTKAERVFMTRSFLFHIYQTRTFMTHSFLLYNKGIVYNIRCYFPFRLVIVKLLTNKETDRHRRVPLIMGGGG